MKHVQLSLLIMDNTLFAILLQYTIFVDNHQMY
uniref:Uncharacterized protein n=1 Tax=Wuchereria bancrofti TaxID=6293 RepID=A0A1I8EI38_WUCBA